MKNDKYIMSFTTGGLFHLESVKLAGLFLELGDWNAVREKVISGNVLQARTRNSLKRVCREVISRLRTLAPHELDLLIRGSAQEQRYLLWLSVCRYYKFIADFADEVVHEHYVSLKNDLRYEDFDWFFNKKSEWHIELDKIRPTSRCKLRQVLFKILREADLLTPNNTINSAMLSPQLLDMIQHGNRQEVLRFPMFESELKGWAQ